MITRVLLVPALLALIKGGASSPLQRQVRMYWNTADPESNLQWVRAHGGPIISQYMTGVLPCCNIASIQSNGSLVVTRDISAIVRGYQAYNLTVHPVATIASVATQAGLEAALNGVASLVQWLRATGADGVVIDYEPSTNYTTQHARNYAAFLGKLQAAAAEAGKESGPDLAGWGILDQFSLYCSAEASFYTTMSPWYQGANVTQLQGLTQQLLSSGCPASAVHVGISDQCAPPSNATCAWTQLSLAQWVQYLRGSGVRGIDVWTPDKPENTPPFYFQQFKAFLAG